MNEVGRRDDLTVYEQIIYEVDDPVATITLNRPDALNAWTPRMGAEVRHAVAQAERDPAVVGIVITGSGRGFCAGADMNTLAGISGGDGAVVGVPAELDATAGDASWGDDFRGEYTYLMAVPKPVIAAINGPIAGMAVPIALCCDLRFMATDAVLTTSFSQRGLIAEWGSSWLLPRLVGSAVALDLLFSARKVDGVEAERLGLVNKALPAAEVLGAARAYLAELARRCSPASIATMKRQVYQQLHAGLGPAETESQKLMLETFRRPDFREGVMSYMEKRPPSFARL
jgi:enoyl-CoA hydratase/carnithine racemase